MLSLVCRRRATKISLKIGQYCPLRFIKLLGLRRRKTVASCCVEFRFNGDGFELPAMWSRIVHQLLIVRPNCFKFIVARLHEFRGSLRLRVAKKILHMLGYLRDGSSPAVLAVCPSGHLGLNFGFFGLGVFAAFDVSVELASYLRLLVDEIGLKFLRFGLRLLTQGRIFGDGFGLCGLSVSLNRMQQLRDCRFGSGQ